MTLWTLRIVILKRYQAPAPHCNSMTRVCVRRSSLIRSLIISSMRLISNLLHSLICRRLTTLGRFQDLQINCKVEGWRWARAHWWHCIIRAQLWRKCSLSSSWISWNKNKMSTILKTRWKILCYAKSSLKWRVNKLKIKLNRVVRARISNPIWYSLLKMRHWETLKIMPAACMALAFVRFTVLLQSIKPKRTIDFRSKISSSGRVRRFRKNMMLISFWERSCMNKDTWVR